MKSRTKEDWLLETLDEAKRLIIAQNVIVERRVEQGPYRRINDLVDSYLFSALLVNMGWKIPKTMYDIWDGLTDFLCENEENIEDGN